MLKVAYQGTQGSYSEMAVYQHYGKNEVMAIGYELSEQVFDAVEKHEAQVAILPVENSIAGNVTVNTDLFFHYHLHSIGEIYVPINHCLMGPPGSKIEDIKEVFSHPVAIAQCRKFLHKHKIVAHPSYDTAGASREISESKIKGRGAISSFLCTQYYDIELLKEGIQDLENNITRFLVLVNKKDVPKDLIKEKTSMAFTTHHHPGALLECLQKFADYDINLTKLESRPIPEDPFSYIFFTDFLGSPDDPNVKDCLGELVLETRSIKILGSYPIGQKDWEG